MNKSKFVSIKKVLPDVFDTISELNIGVGDILEWSSKAMDQIGVYEAYEEAVAFKTVVDFQTFLPAGLIQINQILYKQDFNLTEEDVQCCKNTSEVYQNFSDKYLLTDDEYISKNWLPLRASTNNFLLSVLCENSPNLHTNCQHEYTVLPNCKVVTSFKDGYILISYFKAPMDEEGNYLIPEDEELIEALRAYVLFRLWERRWNMKEDGADQRMKFYSDRWAFYKSLYRGKAKLLTQDQYQNILEYKTNLLPKRNRYYSYFGTLGVPDTTFF